MAARLGLKRRSAAASASSRGAERCGSLSAVLARDRVDMENIKRLIAFCLHADSCCIDIGAHRGSVLREIVRVAPLGTHWAYEPLPHLAADLRDVFPTVSIRQAALSDHQGAAPFQHVIGDAEGCSGFRVCTVPPGLEGQVETISVPVERLDDSPASEVPVAFLKIDVEGAEQQVLEGARDTLLHNRPTIVFEHTFAASNAYGTSPEDIYTFLSGSVGLRVFDLDGNGPLSGEDFEGMSYAGDPINFVAHP
jgi:FkbM family methyltransferase